MSSESRDRTARAATILRTTSSNSRCSAYARRVIRSIELWFLPCRERSSYSCSITPRSRADSACRASDTTRSAAVRVWSRTIFCLAGTSRSTSASSSCGSRLACSRASSACTLATRPFWADTGKTRVRRQVKRGGRGLDLAPDLALDLVGRLQRVPQPVDLVEHGDVVAMSRVADDVPPDVEVAARDAGVGREHEQHRVRARNERQRQFRLRPDRVQARRVEDHEAPLQQRMREVDDRVAPLRDLDHAARVDGDGLVGIFGIEQPVAARLLDGHPDRLGDHPERAEHSVRRTRVDRKHLPLVGKPLEVGRGSGPAARLDRQRAYARRQRRVVQQFGRAHRRAPRGRRQHALAVLREEDRVDQFGLAAGELGDEGDDELVLGEAIEREIEAPPDVAVEHLRLAHPLAQVDDRLRQRVAPVAVFLESGSQGSHGCGGSP